MARKWILIACCAAATYGFAEMREWTDKKGNKIEAEFNGVKDKKIVLVNEDGKEYRVPLENFSNKDLEYLQGKVPDSLFKRVLPKAAEPPRLEIDFKKITDTGSTDDDSSYRNIDMVTKVAIAKKSAEPYTGKLKAQLFVIGFNKDEDRYIMLDTKEHEFNFKSEDEISFEGAHFIIREYMYDDDYSTQYEGYLVVILDEQGRVLAKRSNSSTFEKNYSKLSKFEKGSYFNKKFKSGNETTDSNVYY